MPKSASCRRLAGSALACLLPLVGLLVGGCSTTGAYVPSGARVESPVEIGSEADFESSVLQADRPVIVVFHSPSCHNCRSLMAKLGGLVNEFGGDARFAVVNVREQPGLRRAHRVGGVPVLAFFDHGREVDRSTGNWPAFILKHDIRGFLGVTVRP